MGSPNWDDWWIKGGGDISMYQALLLEQNWSNIRLSHTWYSCCHHLILKAVLWDRCNYYHHFSDGKIGSQSWSDFGRWPSWEEGKLVWIMACVSESYSDSQRTDWMTERLVAPRFGQALSLLAWGSLSSLLSLERESGRGLITMEARPRGSTGSFSSPSAPNVGR